MPPSMNRGSVWQRIVDSSIHKLQSAFIALGSKEDFFLSGTELIGVDREYVRDVGMSYTLYVCKYKRVFIRQKRLQRNVLRIVDFGEDPPGQPYDYRRNNSEDLTPYNGPEPLRCELFLSNPRLRDIAERTLEPFTKRLGYPRVEYIDMSRDPSAWYPDELPKLPEARIVNA